jgi:hypothetical protein
LPRADLHRTVDQRRVIGLDRGCVNRLVPVVGAGAAGADADGAELPAAPGPPELDLGLGLGLAGSLAAGELIPAPGERTASPVPAAARVTTSPARDPAPRQTCGLARRMAFTMRAVIAKEPLTAYAAARHPAASRRDDPSAG